MLTQAVTQVDASGPPSTHSTSPPPQRRKREALAPAQLDLLARQRTRHALGRHGAQACLHALQLLGEAPPAPPAAARATAARTRSLAATSSSPRSAASRPTARPSSATRAPCAARAASSRRSSAPACWSQSCSSPGCARRLHRARGSRLVPTRVHRPRLCLLRGRPAIAGCLLLLQPLKYRQAGSVAPIQLLVDVGDDPLGLFRVGVHAYGTEGRPQESATSIARSGGPWNHAWTPGRRTARALPASYSRLDPYSTDQCFGTSISAQARPTKYPW